MKRDWSGEELGEHWTLMPGERALLANKTGATRLGFAVLLKFFQLEGRFPRQSQEVPSAGVEYLAGQIGVTVQVAIRSRCGAGPPMELSEDTGSDA
jgi:Domain of unknown function (DUF4158)